MKINDVFPSKYLSAADLDGKTVKVVIEDVKMEEIGEGDNVVDKAVMYFRGKQKALVLNKTNWNTISDIHGEDTDSWGGGEILLFPTQTEFQGRAVACIRVKLGKALADAEKFVEAIKQDESQGVVPDDDIPF